MGRPAEDDIATLGMSLGDEGRERGITSREASFLACVGETGDDVPAQNVEHGPVPDHGEREPAGVGASRGACQGLEKPLDQGGIEAPAGSKNLELTPYAISSLTSDNLATPPVLNDAAADTGVDLKYGITQNVTADLTYNTDFAQLEADDLQVNLTRFDLVRF